MMYFLRVCGFGTHVEVNETNVIVALHFPYLTGNVGLWDQLMAMKWVKKNAEKFGGDPESITLFGESAGGGSVSFHLLSPFSRDYITRGIIQSGTLNTPWSIMDARTAKKIAWKLADDSNCTHLVSVFNLFLS